MTLKIIFVFLLISICLEYSTGRITFEEDVTITYQQKETLDEFKEIMLSKPLPQKFMGDDLYLLKWLRYNDFNIKQAEENLRNHFIWWKENKMDEIDKEEFPDIEQDFKYYLDGRDKFGRSFIYFEIKGMDLRRTLIQGNGERLNRYIDKALYQACTLVRELGYKYKNITRGHLIINLDGYNLVQVGCLRCIPFILRITISYEEHYPECADYIISVNSPPAVEPIVKGIRGLLSPDMRRGVRVYGTNRKQWMKELEEDFDLDKLPPALGGTQIYKGMEDLYN